MIKPMLLSAVMTVSLGLGTGITAIDNVIVQSAHAQVSGQARCTYHLNANFVGRSLTVNTLGNGASRGNFASILNNRVNSFTISTNRVTGLNTLFNRTNQNNNLQTIRASNGRASANVSRPNNDRTSSYQCTQNLTGA